MLHGALNLLPPRPPARPKRTPSIRQSSFSDAEIIILNELKENDDPALTELFEQFVAYGQLKYGDKIAKEKKPVLKVFA